MCCNRIWNWRIRWRIVVVALLMSALSHAANTTIPVSTIRQPSSTAFNLSNKLTLAPISGISLDAGSGRIIGVATPTAGTDAVNKTYADSLSCTGCLIASNNLSDVTNPAAARANLGITSGLPSQTGFGPSGSHFLTTDGTNAAWGIITLDNVAAAFTITGFSSAFFGTYELGQTIATSPTFTVSYNRTAAAATLNDGVHSVVSLSSPYTSGTLPYTYTCNSTPNSSQSVTVTANESGGPSKNTNNNAVCRTRVWYGMQTPGTITSSFITTLPSTQLVSGIAGTFAFGAGGNTKAGYLCHDSAFTLSTFKDASTGFAIPVTAQSGVSVTNAYGVARTIVCEKTDQLLNSAFSGTAN